MYSYRAQVKYCTCVIAWLDSYVYLSENLCNTTSCYYYYSTMHTLISASQVFM